MFRALICVLLLSGSTFAQQFVAKAEVITGMSGLINPRIVGQQVVFDAGSHPKIGQLGIITVDPNAKSALVVIMRSVFDTIQLKPSGDGTYGFGGQGEYAVHVTIVNAEGILQFENLKVDLQVLDPIGPDIETLSPVAKKSREVMRTFVESIATNYKVLSMDAKAGKFKNVSDASVAANTLDLISRNEFKQTMGKLMEPELGNTVLPLNATKTFNDISIGFGGVK